jgi:hypothetical protein
MASTTFSGPVTSTNGFIGNVTATTLTLPQLQNSLLLLASHIRRRCW